MFLDEPAELSSISSPFDMSRFPNPHSITLNLPDCFYNNPSDTPYPKPSIKTLHQLHLAPLHIPPLPPLPVAQPQFRRVGNLPTKPMPTSWRDWIDPDESGGSESDEGSDDYEDEIQW